MKLALGTAQFGMSYGVTNVTGKVGFSEVTKILTEAAKKDVDCIDTAINYGGSESCLGEAGVDDFNVITKLPRLPDNEMNISEWVRTELDGSIKRLNRCSIYALILHHPSDLLGKYGEILYRALQHAKNVGLVEKVGISIYSPSELDMIASKFRLDLVQAPFNLIDRRLETSGWLRRLSEMGVEVHTRSVFLQGLLLVDVESLPEYFSPWRPVFTKWREWVEQSAFDPLQACLLFAQSKPQIQRVIVGVDSRDQFMDILSASTSVQCRDWPDVACNDEMLINPSNWKS